MGRFFRRGGDATDGGTGRRRGSGPAAGEAPREYLPKPLRRFYDLYDQHFQATMRGKFEAWVASRTQQADDRWSELTSEVKSVMSQHEALIQQNIALDKTEREKILALTVRTLALEEAAKATAEKATAPPKADPELLAKIKDLEDRLLLGEGGGSPEAGPAPPPPRSQPRQPARRPLQARQPPPPPPEPECCDGALEGCCEAMEEPPPEPVQRARPPPSREPITEARKSRPAKPMAAGQWQDKFLAYLEVEGEEGPPATAKAVKEIVAETRVFRCMTGAQCFLGKWPNSKISEQMLEGICERLGYARSRDGQEVVFCG